jgi:transglutaminase-like putative cysteine protease
MPVHDPGKSGNLAVSITFYLRIALYFMVASGFVTLASTGQLDFPTMVVVSAAVLYRGYLLLRGSTLLLKEAWTTGLTLAITAFFVFDFFLLTGGFVTATVHFVLLLMIVRLLSARRNRDYVFLAVLAFLMVLSAAVLTVNSTFLLMFACFMLASVATFILMEMRRSSEQASIQAREPSAPVQRQMAWSLIGISPALMLLILAGASLIFFLLPRLSSGYLSAYTKTGDLGTGFSNRVELGRIGEIQQSNAVVMHIQIAGDRNGAYDLKWRGVSLSMFDGRIWSNPLEQRPAPRIGPDIFALTPAASPWNTLHLEAPTQSTNLIRYRVLLEPIGTNVFFLAPEAQTLEGNYQRVTIDRGGSIYNLDAQHPIGRYDATSALPTTTSQRLRTASGSLPPGIDLYLQLPPLDSRIPELARRITANAANQYDRASAVEHFLATNYGYTLQLGNRVPKDPLAYFLFDRREGHCEYFASSMAVMLRSIGIPSRVVNGFRTGEFNDINSQYVVRARNAHSWVEAYFPEYGWVSFDPTPGAPFDTHSGWSRVMLYFDAVQSFWREWVINYDFTHQRALGQEANQRGRRLVESTRGWAHRNYDSLLGKARRLRLLVVRAPRMWGFGTILAVALLFLVIKAGRIARLIRLRQIASHPESAPRTAATIWYSRMTRAIARRGWRKSPSQTPAEFINIIEDPQLRLRVQVFTERYEKARFDDSPEDARQLSELYEEILKEKGK